jgi:hypothetical protein
MTPQVGGMKAWAFSPSGSVSPQERPLADQAPWYRTTRVEQWLLVVTAALQPLENHVPAVMGFGFMSFVFGVLALYVLWNRVHMLEKVWLHPVFLTAYGFLLGIFLIELTHPHTDYSEIMRIVQMFVGAIFIASLCRDQAGLRAGMYGWLVAGSWVTVLVIVSSYGDISAMSAMNFAEANEVREQAFEDIGLKANLNGLAFFPAQGAIAALAMGIAERSFMRQSVFLGLALTCTIGAFLPMSRGAILMLGVGCVAVMGVYGLLKGRIIMILALLSITILILVPEAVFTRMVYKSQSYEPGKLEGRTLVYTAVIESFPDYVLAGAGAGNFWKSWGRRHGFAYGRGVLGSHNCFAQATIYWGILGLFGVLAVIWQVYRRFPRSCGTHPLKLCLLGTTMALLAYMTTMHLLYAKELSLGLGFLVGASLWVWPRSMAGTRFQRQQIMTLPSR